jgi:hypothetical protein
MGRAGFTMYTYTGMESVEGWKAGDTEYLVVLLPPNKDTEGQKDTGGSFTLKHEFFFFQCKSCFRAFFG